MLDTVYVNHPTHGLIRVGTNPMPRDATPEEHVVRVVLIRHALDQQIRDSQNQPRRYYG